MYLLLCSITWGLKESICKRTLVLTWRLHFKIVYPFTSHEWPRENFSSQCQYNTKQTSDESKEQYQFGDFKLIQYQILQTNIIRTVWQTVRRITNELLGVKGLSNCAFCQGLCHYSFPFLFHDKLFSNVLLSFSKLHVKNSHAGHFASKSPIKITRIVT